MISELPLVISVGNAALRKGERPFSPPRMMPLLIYSLSAAGLATASCPPLQGDRGLARRSHVDVAITHAMWGRGRVVKEA